MPIFVATKRVVTCTVKHMKTLVNVKCGYDISLGELNFLKLFFVTNATEKERVLCMCKCCLNMRLKFDVIMSHIKANEGETYSSISDFLIKNCTCDRNENGFYDLKCCTGNCDECVEHFPFPNYQNLTLPK